MNCIALNDITWPNGELRACAGDIFDDFVRDDTPDRAKVFLYGLLRGARYARTTEELTVKGVPADLHSDFRFFDVTFDESVEKIDPEPLTPKLVERDFEEVEGVTFPDPFPDSEE